MGTRKEVAKLRLNALLDKDAVGQGVPIRPRLRGQPGLGLWWSATLGELRGQHQPQGSQEKGLGNYRATVKGDTSTSHFVTGRRRVNSFSGSTVPGKKRGGEIPLCAF